MPDLPPSATPPSTGSYPPDAGAYPPMGAYPPGGPTAPVQPPPKGMHGCLKGCLISLGVLLVMTCVAAGLAYYFAGRLKAWLFESGAELFIDSISQSAKMPKEEVDEMKALARVMVKGFQEDTFKEAHQLKIANCTEPLNHRSNQNNPPTRKEILKLMDDLEQVCRDAGCDMKDIDRLRAKRGPPPAEEPDTGPPEDGGEAPESPEEND